MKFLVDESAGIAVSRKLKQMNFDAFSVIQVMKGAGDEEIGVVGLMVKRVRLESGGNVNKIGIPY